MKIIRSACIFFCAARLWAGQGVIHTTDGRRVEGEIHAEPGTFLVTATNSPGSRLKVSNVSRLEMKSAGAKADLSMQGKVHGLKATYFRTKDLTGEKVVRIDPAIDFDWQEK